MIVALFKSLDEMIIHELKSSEFFFGEHLLKIKLTCIILWISYHSLVKNHSFKVMNICIVTHAIFPFHLLCGKFVHMGKVKVLALNIFCKKKICGTKLRSFCLGHSWLCCSCLK